MQHRSADLAHFAGHILYHGPRADCLAFFQSLGFDIPERKDVPDFLQEVSGRKDQEVRQSFLHRNSRNLSIDAFTLKPYFAFSGCRLG